MDERVLKGKLPDGKTFMLTATGPETPVLDSDLAELNAKGD